MDGVEFVMDLEDAFGIKIDDAEAEHVEWTVGAWHAYLVRRRPELDAQTIWEKELDAICRIMHFDAERRELIRPTDHLVRDLGFT